MRCGHEVPGTILLHDLKGAMQLECSKDVCACFTLQILQFQFINARCVEVVALKCISTACHKSGWAVFRAVHEIRHEMKQGAFSMILKANDKVCNGNRWHPVNGRKLTHQNHTKGIVHIEFIPQGQRVNQVYVEILKQLHEAVYRKWPELWLITFFTTTMLHLTRSCQEVSGPEINQWNGTPSLVPRLAVNDFWLFPKIKSALKEWKFWDIEDIQQNVTMAPKAIPQQVFQKYFQQCSIVGLSA